MASVPRELVLLAGFWLLLGACGQRSQQGTPVGLKTNYVCPSKPPQVCPEGMICESFWDETFGSTAPPWYGSACVPIPTACDPLHLCTCPAFAPDAGRMSFARCKLTHPWPPGEGCWACQEFPEHGYVDCSTCSE